MHHRKNIRAIRYRYAFTCRFLLAAVLLLLFFEAAAMAQPYTPGTDNILYVDQNVSGGNQSGNSWVNAIPDLARALQWAENNNANWTAGSPLRIWVARGTYLPDIKSSNRKYFRMVNHVQLYGGFAGGETTLNARDWQTNVTTLKGDGESVIWNSFLSSDPLTNSAVLDGFTVTGGSDYDGGGIYNSHASPVLTNLIISGNTADEDGGGIYNTFSSSPVLINVLITGNTAAEDGGGIHDTFNSSPVLINVTISGNIGTRGGGMSNGGFSASYPTIYNSIIYGNTNANGNRNNMYNPYGNTPKFYYSLLQGAIVWNTDWGDDEGGNLTTLDDPFENSASGDYRLANGSPAINAGNNSYYTDADKGNGNLNTDLDLAGNPRLVGTRIDMGAYEYRSVVNELPAIMTSSGTASFTKTFSGSSVSAVIDAGVKVSDPDYTTLAAASVAITVNFQSGQDVLDFTNDGITMGNIEGDYDAGTGVLTLVSENATATLAEWEAALASVTYSNTSPTPNTNNRTISFVIDNGQDQSRPGKKTIEIIIELSPITPSTDDILYINQNVVGGNQSGDSWGNAFPELADALQWAREQHDADNNWLQGGTLKIYVAAGTYLPKYTPADGAVDPANPANNRNKTFLLARNVQLYGGFPNSGDPGWADRDWEVNKTILSGDIGRRNDISDNAYHVVVSVGDVGAALLHGFNIQGGNANGSSILSVYGEQVGQHNGGGMFNQGSSPGFSHVIIHSNRSNNNGGGMFNISSFPVLTHVTIHDNQSGNNGGGIFNNSSSIAPALTNVLIHNNRANNNGGGMFNNSSSPVLTNVTISGNRANNQGGGIYNNNSLPQIYNSIVWGNTRAGGNRANTYNENSTPEFYHSLLQGNVAWNADWGADKGGNKTTLDNPFANNGSGDYRLWNCSPAFNAGNNQYYTDALSGNGSLVNDSDLAGNPRLYDENIDMGAYENQGEACITPTNNILYVNQSAPTESDGSGDSWNNALPELADALSWARTNSTSWTTDNPLQIWVATGTYHPMYHYANNNSGGGSYRSFVLLKNVALYGGFDPANGIVDLDDERILPTNETDGSVLSGDINGDDVITGSGENLVLKNNGENVLHTIIASGDLGTGIVLDGFTITGGGASYYSTTPDLNGNAISSASGGGIYCVNSSPVFNHIKVTGNSGSSNAGIYLERSSPTITHSIISKNFTVNWGGGIGAEQSSPVLTEVQIHGNKADLGSGAGGYASNQSELNLTNVTIHDNYANHSGGGIFNSDGSSMVVTDSEIYNNKTAIAFGGGLNNIGASTSAELNNVAIYNNDARYGGGVCNEEGAHIGISKSQIYDNSSQHGGGIFNRDPNVQIEINLSKIYGNTATESGGGIYNAENTITITDSEIYDNTAGTTGGGMISDGGTNYTIKNVKITGNSATWGGGIYNWEAAGNVLNSELSKNNAPYDTEINNHLSTLTLINTTVFNNAASDVVYSNQELKVYNSIIWGNTDITGNYTAKSSIVKGSSDISDGNIDASDITPSLIFRNVPNGDFQLIPCSPAIDAGNNSLFPGVNEGTLDLAGNSRIIGEIIDMGAYENQGEACVSPTDNILYVNQNAPTESDGSGDSWNNAIPELADALQWAKQQHDADNNWLQNDHLQIYVAKGTYLPKHSPEDEIANPSDPTDNRNKTFLLVKNVQLYGGFPDSGSPELADRDWEANKTILSGDFERDDEDDDFDNHTENAYHVVVSIGDVGNALLDGFSIQGGNADGTSSLSVNGVSVAQHNGGGMFNKGSSPVLNHIAIQDSRADDNGGGMFNNSSSPVLTNITINGNKSDNNAGGIYNLGSSSPVLANVTISGNTAGNGGGMANSNSSPKVYNSILYGNTDANGNRDNIANTSSAPTFYHSLLQGEAAWNTDWGDDEDGNVTTLDDPFENSANGDYTLILGSPAINAGNDTYYTDADKGNGDLDTDLDLAGNPRLVGVRIDMGAYEYQTAINDPPTITTSGGATTFTKLFSGSSVPVMIDGGLTVSDLDNTTLAAASVAVTVNFQSGQDVLDFANDGTPMGNIEGAYDADAGVLTLTSENATATIAEWQAALGTVTYSNTSPTPNTIDRTISFVVDDGQDQSNPATKTIEIIEEAAPITPGTGNILHVDQNVPGGNGSGDGWDNALSDLAPALQWARANKDGGLWDADNPLKIYVATGEYQPAPGESFEMVDAVEIYGGFDPAGGRTTLSDRILPGGLPDDGIAGTILKGNGKSVIRNVDDGLTNKALLDGFTITDGDAANGGGIYLVNVSPRLNHVAIFGNLAEYGGGICLSGSSATLTNVTISGNRASSLTFYSLGGGMSILDSSPTLANVVISGNHVAASGASYYARGGGMYVSNSTPVLTNVTLSGNRASSSLPAAFASGGGMYIEPSASVTLTNSVVWENVAGGNPAISGALAATSTHNLIEGGHGSNIDDIPSVLAAEDIFLSPVAAINAPTTDGDFRLKRGSPAVNTGDNTTYTAAGGNLETDSDLADNPRLLGGTIDLGAYESLYEDITAFTDPAGITVAYGTALADVPLPADFTVEVILSDASTEILELDGDKDNWVLILPTDRSYAPMAAGTYTFEVPVLPPAVSDPYWFSNSGNLKARLTVTVSKGTPALTATWAGTSVVAADGLDLTYGDINKLAISHDNTDADAEPQLGFSAGYIVLDLVDPSAVRAILTGTGTLRVTLPETDNFEEAILEFDVRTRPKLLTLTAMDQYKIYGDLVVFDETEFTVDGLAFDDEVTSVTLVSDGAAVASGVGDYDIIASDPQGTGLDNYMLMYENGTLSVGPLAVEVTAGDGSKSFRAPDPALAYTVTPALVGSDMFTGELVREPGEDVGEYGILQGDLSLNANYDLTFVPGTFSITKADIKSATFEDGSFTYDGTAHSLSIAGVPEGATVTYTGNGQVAAGTHTVTALVQMANHDELELSATLTIHKAEAVITAEGVQEHIYDGTLKNLVASLNHSETVLAYTPQRSYTEAGRYPVVVSAPETGNYFAAAPVDVELVIATAEQDGITFEDGEAIYDGTAHSIYVSGAPKGATVTYTNNGRTDVGIYTITATVKQANHSDLELTANLTIHKAQPSVTASAEQTHTYDGTAKAVQATVEPAELAGQLQYSPQQSFTSVGMHRVRVYVNESANYLSAATYVDFSITPAEQQGLHLPDLTVTYDGQPHALEVAGLPADAEVSYTINGHPGNVATDAGTYEIKTVVSRANHVDQTLEATLTIHRAAITGIALGDTSFVYDGTAKHLSIDESQLPEGTRASYNNNTRTDVGSQTVTATIGGGNYETLELAAELVITPAERSIEFPALTDKTYGDGDFSINATASTGEGILYTSSNPAVAEVGADGTITIMGAGETMITAMLAENDNYVNMPLVSRILTVGKANQTITLSAPAEVNRDAGMVPVEATSSSGLPVSLSLDDPEVATLECTTLHIHRLGTVRITATQEGDANHESAERVTVMVRVIDPGAELPVRVSKAVSPNGDGINEYLVIEGIKEHPENRVSIFNRNGTVVYEANGYNNGSVAFRGIGTGQHRLPAGTYFYVAEVRVAGKWKYEKGWFVLRY